MARFTPRIVALTAVTFTTFATIFYFVRRYLYKGSELAAVASQESCLETGQGDRLHTLDKSEQSGSCFNQASEVNTPMTSLNPVLKRLAEMKECESLCEEIDESLIVEVDSDEEITSTVEIIDLDSSSYLYRSIMGSLDEDGADEDAHDWSYDAGEDALNDGEDALNDGEDALNDGEDALNDGEDALNDGEDALNDDEDALNKDEDALNDGEDAMNDESEQEESTLQSYVLDESLDNTSGLNESTANKSLLEESLQQSSVLDDSTLKTAGSSFLDTSKYTSAILDEMKTPSWVPISPLVGEVARESEKSEHESLSKSCRSESEVHSISLKLSEENIEDSKNNEDLKNNEDTGVCETSDVSQNEINNDTKVTPEASPEKNGESVNASMVHIREKFSVNLNKNYSIDDDNVVSLTDSLDSTAELSDDSLNITETIDEVEANVSKKCKFEESQQEVLLDETCVENGVIEISDDDEKDVIISSSETRDDDVLESSVALIDKSHVSPGNNTTLDNDVDETSDKNTASRFSDADADDSRHTYSNRDDIITDYNINAVIHASVADFVRVSDSSNMSQATFSGSDIKNALRTSSESPGLVDQNCCDVLVSLLRHDDVKMATRVLSLISRCAAFSSKHAMFNKAGCLSELSRLIAAERVIDLCDEDANLMLSLCNAITNLAMNEDNLNAMADCVRPLIDITASPSTPDSIKQYCLESLTNLGLMPTHHPRYAPLIHELYRLVDGDSEGLRLQGIKILVNLSCNTAMVPHLLAAKAPESSLTLLDPNVHEATLLRWVTFLANVITISAEQGLTSSTLPVVDKAPSPETMYWFLHGVHSTGFVKTRAFILSSHGNEDVRMLAMKIYSGLSRSTVV